MAVFFIPPREDEDREAVAGVIWFVRYFKRLATMILSQNFQESWGYQITLPALRALPSDGGELDRDGKRTTNE